jgi:hypothetical protein
MNIEQRFALYPYAGQHSAQILRRFGEANNASDASVESIESLVLLFLAGQLKKGLLRTPYGSGSGSIHGSSNIY